MKVNDKVLILKGEFQGKIGRIVDIRETHSTRRKYTVTVFIGYRTYPKCEPIYEDYTLREIKKVK
jgi:transcription antitermination factor NusG